jgi:DNA-binding transcriptional LysR family regulator
MNSNVLIELEIVDHSKRLDGLRNGTYDVVFGIIDPSIESFLALNFIRMAAEGFSVYADKDHPLANRAALRETDLRGYSWVNHKFEFGLYDSGSAPDTRNYALKVNTLLNTVQIIRGTELLISASSGFVDMFGSFGLTRICTDVSRPILPSGAIHWGSLDEKPYIRKFVNMTKSFLAEDPSMAPALNDRRS